MPVYRSPTHRNEQTSLLTARLAEVLDHPQTPGQPFVIENRVNGIGSLHVTVIWDDWHGLSYAQRSKAILDAYELHSPSGAQGVTIALGATGNEAVRMGLVPYAISCAYRPGDEEIARRATQLMRDRGAFETSNGPQLRFYSEDQAVSVLEQLKAELPKATWFLTHELRSGDE